MNNVSVHINNWLSKAFNLSILEKSRMPWVDYLRGIAILLVVYRHVLIGLERSAFAIPPALVTANMIFFSFRMPLFFILSGIFIGGSIAKRPLGQLINIKFENLLYPYFIWAFLQITLQVVFSRFTNAGRTAHDYIFILTEPKALDQFWYLPALFNATVIYLILKMKLKVPTWLQLFIGIGLYYLAPQIKFSSMVSDWMAFYIFFALGDWVSGFFFKPATQQFLKNNITLLVMIPVFILTQMYYLSHDVGLEGGEFLVIAILGCISMFILAFHLQKWNVLSFLRVLGYHSLFIYVMHVIVAAFWRMIMVKAFHISNPVILLFSGIFVGVVIPVIVYNLFIRNNRGWFLFSMHKPERYKRVSKENEKLQPKEADAN